MVSFILIIQIKKRTLACTSQQQLPPNILEKANIVLSKKGKNILNRFNSFNMSLRYSCIYNNPMWTGEFALSQGAFIIILFHFPLIES